MESVIAAEKDVEAVFSKKPLSIEEGDGVYVYDGEGEEYLDFGASYGVMAVGHSNPSVVEAIREQAGKYTYAQASYATKARASLLERLKQHTPEALERVFLTNAGTEANETAFKLARASTPEGKTKVVAAENGFHGRTFGSISATYKKKYRQPFEPTVPEFEFTGFDDPESLKETVDDDTAMVILEPVQGEGGVQPASQEYVETARDVCSDHDSYLVFDEIQAGLGRTGRLWSHQHYDVTPDALTTAKALGGGMPVSALVCREAMTEIPKGSHGGTYCGNPVAAAAADAAVEHIVEEDLAANAAEKGERLIEGLREIDSDRVVEVRGRGLMVGVQVRGRAGRYLSGMAQEGVLALPAGSNVIRMLPPLTLEDEHVDEAVEAVEAVV